MITIRGLKKRFRRHEALQGLDLEIPEGKVTAFLGPNGAGKTTTIKCAMNLIDRDAGEVTVMGVDARKLSPTEWQRIGYVSENRKMPEWMTVPKLLDYVRPMYGKYWDRDFEKKLLAGFDLPLETRLSALSRGQRMKAALLSALAYRPQLVVLDEPFSGLDPLVRDEFLSGLLELTETEGWTVWISSHDINEVERLADRVAIMGRGKLAVQEEVEILKQRFRRIEIWFDQEPVVPAIVPASWQNLNVSSRHLSYTDINYDCDHSLAEMQATFPTVRSHNVHPMSLREIFIYHAKSDRNPIP